MRKNTGDFTIAFQAAKKQQSVSFGAYPQVSLKQALQRRDEVKLLIARGTDPKQAAKQLRQGHTVALEHTFADVAEKWLAYRADIKKWSPKHHQSTKSSLERFMYPRIGSHPVTEIEPMQILPILQEFFIHDKKMKPAERYSKVQVLRR
ncbi:integrase arm-type DNA-binding domain-containing protein, partial [uncultured Cardiobacterium sp.]|uniref:tyrosine-type recombinase/integrase n=1 Tax=uncultured Cardiobacterium sp. TaxID=417619 RepID=UPI00262F1434